jgi:hypothetical protein
MTEVEWQTGTNPMLLLRFVLKRFEERKVRLFTCACCQRVVHLMKDERSLEALQCAERLAEQDAAGGRGQPVIFKAAVAAAQKTRRVADATADPARHLAAQAECAAAWAAAFAVETNTDTESAADQASVHAGLAVAYASCKTPPARTSFPPDRENWLQEEMHRQVQLLREIVGDPFHPATVDPAWLAWNGGGVARLVQSIYEERTFDHLPVLSDALEDAGCDNADLLAHCRQPGEHVRGCWVVDLLLGKE